MHGLPQHPGRGRSARHGRPAARSHGVARRHRRQVSEHAAEFDPVAAEPAVDGPEQFDAEHGRDARRCERYGGVPVYAEVGLTGVAFAPSSTAVAFYVQKSLAHGPIRFGVSPRQALDKIDSEAALSTGPRGEFARRSGERFFFAGSPAPIGAPQIPVEKSISSTPFWASLRPDGTPRRWGFLALLIVGAILILLGLAVVVNKGPAGWVEVILGTAMVTTPIALTAQERKKIREQEEKERVEREERERRHREMLAAYTAALQKLSENVNDETLRTLRREREALDLPYEIWSQAARETILAIGFDALARLSPARAKEIADQMRRAAEAAGLTPEDEAAVRQAVYRVALWHLIADDRIGATQKQQLDRLRTGLAVDAAAIAADAAAEAQ